MARKATGEEQLSSKTIHPVMRAQLHLPAIGICCPVLVSMLFNNSAARQSIQLWEPCFTSLIFISPDLCLFQCCFTTPQQDKPSSYEKPAPPPCSWYNLPGSLSRACFSVVLQLHSKTNHPAMRAQLHFPALDLSCPVLVSMLLYNSAARQPSSYESPAPPSCSWSLLGTELTL